MAQFSGKGHASWWRPKAELLGVCRELLQGNCRVRNGMSDRDTETSFVIGALVLVLLVSGTRSFKL